MCICLFSVTVHLMSFHLFDCSVLNVNEIFKKKKKSSLAPDMLH